MMAEGWDSSDVESYTHEDGFGLCGTDVSRYAQVSSLRRTPVKVTVIREIPSSYRRTPKIESWLRPTTTSKTYDTQSPNTAVHHCQHTPYQYQPNPIHQIPRNSRSLDRTRGAGSRWDCGHQCRYVRSYNDEPEKDYDDRETECLRREACWITDPRDFVVLPNGMLGYESPQLSTSSQLTVSSRESLNRSSGGQMETVVNESVLHLSRSGEDIQATPEQDDQSVIPPALGRSCSVISLGKGKEKQSLSVTKHCYDRSSSGLQPKASVPKQDHPKIGVTQCLFTQRQTTKKRNRTGDDCVLAKYAQNTLVSECRSDDPLSVCECTLEQSNSTKNLSQISVVCPDRQDGGVDVEGPTFCVADTGLDENECAYWEDTSFENEILESELVDDNISDKLVDKKSPIDYTETLFRVENSSTCKCNTEDVTAIKRVNHSLRKEYVRPVPAPKADKKTGSQTHQTRQELHYYATVTSRKPAGKGAGRNNRNPGNFSGRVVCGSNRPADSSQLSGTKQVRDHALVTCDCDDTKTSWKRNQERKSLRSTQNDFKNPCQKGAERKQGQAAPCCCDCMCVPSPVSKYQNVNRVSRNSRGLEQTSGRENAASHSDIQYVWCRSLCHCADCHSQRRTTKETAQRNSNTGHHWGCLCIQCCSKQAEEHPNDIHGYGRRCMACSTFRTIRTESDSYGDDTLRRRPLYPRSRPGSCPASSASARGVKWKASLERYIEPICYCRDKGGVSQGQKTAKRLPMKNLIQEQGKKDNRIVHKPAYGYSGRKTVIKSASANSLCTVPWCECTELDIEESGRRSRCPRITKSKVSCYSACCDCAKFNRQANIRYSESPTNATKRKVRASNCHCGRPHAEIKRKMNQTKTNTTPRKQSCVPCCQCGGFCSRDSNKRTGHSKEQRSWRSPSTSKFVLNKPKTGTKPKQTDCDCAKLLTAPECWCNRAHQDTNRKPPKQAAKKDSWISCNSPRCGCKNPSLEANRTPIRSTVSPTPPRSPFVERARCRDSAEGRYVKHRENPSGRNPYNKTNNVSKKSPTNLNRSSKLAGRKPTDEPSCKCKQLHGHVVKRTTSVQKVTQITDKRSGSETRREEKRNTRSTTLIEPNCQPSGAELRVVSTRDTINDRGLEPLVKPCHIRGCDCKKSILPKDCQCGMIEIHQRPGKEVATPSVPKKRFLLSARFEARLASSARKALQTEELQTNQEHQAQPNIKTLSRSIKSPRGKVCDAILASVCPCCKCSVRKA